MKNAHRKNRRITRIPPSSGSTVALEPENNASDSPVEIAAEETPTVSQRLTVPVTDDGRIDVTRLREKTKSALRRALSDDSLSASLGLSQESASAPLTGEDAALVKTITDSVFMGFGALGVLMAKRAGYANEHAAMLLWSEDERAQVAPLTGKVARKWLPMLDGKYRDECLLGYQVITILAMKIQLMRESAHAARVRAAAPAAEPIVSVNPVEMMQ